jgi:hypothetical protein
MKPAILVPILLACMTLAACGKEKNDESQDAPKLFADQRAMLDKAKNVGNTLQQQADEQQKKLDQQSQ